MSTLVWNWSLLLVISIFCEVDGNVGIFENVLQIPLKRCKVVVYFPTQVKRVDTRESRSSPRLDESVIRLLQISGVPVQTRMISRREAVATVENELMLNNRTSCFTFLLFLRLAPSREGDLRLRPLPWIGYTRRQRATEHDYTILGYEYPETDDFSLDMNENGADLLSIPENLFLLPLEPLRHNYDGTNGALQVKSIGNFRVYCRDSQLICVKWMHDENGKGRIMWSSETEFDRTLGIRSSYFTAGYNFNKALIIVYNNKRLESLYYDQLDLVKILGYRRTRIFEGIAKAKLAQYFQTLSVSSLTYTWNMFNVIENFMNATMKLSKYSQDYRTIYPYINDQGGATVSPPAFRDIFSNWNSMGFCCFPPVSDEIKLLAIFNPMDAGTWICAGLCTIGMILTFWKFAVSPIFTLVTIFFAQGDGDGVRKFSGLLMLWSFLGLLLTSGFSSMIGSFLVVPPTRSDNPSDFKELYQQGYKLIQTQRFANQKILYWFRDDVKSDEAFRKNNAYLFKLSEEMEVISGGSLDEFSYLANTRKRCKFTSDDPYSVPVFEQVIPDLYPGTSYFISTRPMTMTLERWVVLNPNAGVISRIFQLSKSTGFFELNDQQLRLARQYDVSQLLLKSLTKSSRHYKLGYYHKILAEQDWTLFTLRTAQGRLIFYLCISLAGLSTSIFFAEIVGNKIVQGWRSAKNMLILMSRRIRHFRLDWWNNSEVT